jgi:WD40 repeat protein/tRNA A-37 threonylcarbamoyl transferase component Bud32
MRTPLVPYDPTSPTETIKFRPAPNGEFGSAGPQNQKVLETPKPAWLTPGLPRIRRYEILSIVGSGGMGIVYLGRHKELNRRVAIKTLKGEALADPEFRDRFKAEAEAIARLQHPNVIQVFEVGSIEPDTAEGYPSPFIALEFVDGGSLTQHTQTPQPPRKAAKTIEILARAAHAAHLLGIVHRDLKPGNVLLTLEGVPKIADFGIAKQIDADNSIASRTLTRTGTVMGTPEYIAPEQLDKQDATPAIDIYALGVMLYELLTARVPFQGATFADTMILAVRQEAVPPRRLQPNIPRDLETICLKCLEKTPGKRYESAEALADDLARWADGRAIRARSVGMLGRSVRWAKRNPTVALLWVAIMLVAVAGVAGVLWKWNEARANAIQSQDNASRANDAAFAANEAANNAQVAAAQERWERYRMSVFAAASALRLHDVNSARRALDDAPENYRDWVWDLLHAQLDRSQHILPVGGLIAGTVKFTPDGRWVVGLDADRSICLWDLTLRRATVPVRGEQVEKVWISNDGTMLAYNLEGSVIVLCDASTGQSRTVLRGHTGGIADLWFTSEGGRLVSIGSDRTVRLWDARSGRSIHVFVAPPEASPLYVSPDLRLIVGQCEGTLVPRIWDRETGRELARLHGHQDRIRIAQYSPAGDRIVTVEPFPSNIIRLWELPSGKLLATLRGHENVVNNMIFSSDGRQLATSSLDRTVRLWDLSGEPVGGELTPRHVLRGHTGWVTHVFFSSDNTRIVSSSQDRTLRYWNAKSGAQIAVFRGHSKGLFAATGRADGSMLTSFAGDCTLRQWDVGEAERAYALNAHESFVYGVACHPDGRRIASAGWDGTVRIWNVATGQQLFALDHRTPTIESMMVNAVAYHPAGRLLASITRDESVMLWDAETGKRLHQWKIPSRTWQDSRITFSPDGNLLAAGAADGRVHLWDVNTYNEVGTLANHKDGIRDVAFSPNRRWLASSGEDGDCTVQVCDVLTKQQVQILRGHKVCVYAIAWNAAGTLLASASTDGQVYIWDTATWQKVGELRNGVSVHSIAFTPNGKLLAVGCADNLIRVWDVARRQELAELSGHNNYVHSLAFTPDGSRLVSGSGDRTIRVWDTLSPVQRAEKQGKLEAR